jgi:hypothetical protein
MREVLEKAWGSICSLECFEEVFDFRDYVFLVFFRHGMAHWQGEQISIQLFRSL